MTAQSVKQWFADKNDMSTGHILKIQKETEKAILAIVTCRWKGGIDIIKSLWIPKSCIDSEMVEITELEQDALEYIDANNGDIFAASKQFAQWCASCYC